MVCRGSCGARRRALISVVGAWAWVAVQSLGSGRRPALTTVTVVLVATVIMAVTVLRPLLKSYLRAVLHR